MALVAFDIETGPLPESDLIRIAGGYEPDANLVARASEEFDEEKHAKVGTRKDPEKIREKIEEDRAKFLAARDDAKSKLETGEAEYIANLIDKAPLDWRLGRVIAIGVHRSSNTLLIGPEQKIIEAWWRIYNECVGQSWFMVGYNCFSFDLPFLVGRSRVLGIPVPRSVNDGFKQWGWNRQFIDLMHVAHYGDRQAVTSPGTKKGLDMLCAAFGVPGKLEDVSGKDFWRLLDSGDPEQIEKAKQYLARDIECTAALAQKMLS